MTKLNLALDEAPEPIRLHLPPEPSLKTLTLPEQVRQIPALTLIRKRVEYGVREGVPFILVTGEGGLGKSVSATLLAQKPRYLYWQARPEYTPKDVMADILTKLRLFVGEGMRQRTDSLTVYLQDHPHTFQIDEAQRMGRKTLDQLKYVADNAGVTFVFYGAPWLEQIFESRSDLRSRVGVRVKVEPLTLEDFTRLYVNDGYSAKALAAVHESTGGVYRLIDRLLKHLDVAMNDGGMERGQLTPAHVRLVAGEVL